MDHLSNTNDQKITNKYEKEYRDFKEKKYSAKRNDS